MPTPEQKVCILEGSVRCFGLGLCGLIPLLGAAFAPAALRAHTRVWRASARDWNPAAVYLGWGHTLALIGGLLNLALLLGGLVCLLNALSLV